jgi:hypothetical protein
MIAIKFVYMLHTRHMVLDKSKIHPEVTSQETGFVNFHNADMAMH